MTYCRNIYLRPVVIFSIVIVCSVKLTTQYFDYRFISNDSKPHFVDRVSSIPIDSLI